MYQPCQPSHIPQLPGPRLCNHEHGHLLEALWCAQAIQKAAAGDSAGTEDRIEYVIYETEADLLVTPEQANQAYTQAQ